MCSFGRWGEKLSMPMTKKDPASRPLRSSIAIGGFCIGIGAVSGLISMLVVCHIANNFSWSPCLIPLQSFVFLAIGGIAIYKSNEPDPIIRGVLGTSLGLVVGIICFITYLLHV